MEELRLPLPDGGELKALRLQDLPAEHVLAFIGMPPGMKELAGVKLLQLAVGSEGSMALSGMTFAELDGVMTAWMAASGESEETDPDGRGGGIDWSELLR